MAVENPAHPPCSSANRGHEINHARELASRLLNVKEAAHRLGVSVSFLNKARLSGEGPIFIKIGTRVAYDPADLVAWLEARKRQFTGERFGATS